MAETQTGELYTAVTPTGGVSKKTTIAMVAVGQLGSGVTAAIALGKDGGWPLLLAGVLASFMAGVAVFAIRCQSRIDNGESLINKNAIGPAAMPDLPISTS